MDAALTATLRLVRMSVSGDGLVFRTRTGTPYRLFRTAFKHALCQAGLVDVTFHDLRHTFASRLVMAGVGLATGKEPLGHKDITMMLRCTHLSQDHKQQAIRTLGTFGQKSSKIPPIPADRAGDRHTTH